MSTICRQTSGFGNRSFRYLSRGFAKSRDKTRTSSLRKMSACAGIFVPTAVCRGEHDAVTFWIIMKAQYRPLNCPHCGASLLQPDSVQMKFSDGLRTWERSTQVAPVLHSVENPHLGLVADEFGDIARDRSSMASCASCKKQLPDEQALVTVEA